MSRSATDQSNGHFELGWRGIDRDSPEIRAQREYLETSNGLAGLETLHPTEIERAVNRYFSSFHDPRGHLSTRDLPCPYLCVNFLPFDQTTVNGPTRQIPGTQHSRAPIPSLDDEPEWMRLSTVCPAPAGAVQIRDVRAWHGGTPNLSDELRAIPNVEFYAPWFREPTLPSITYADHQKLSAHAQHLTRFSVIDSSEELPTGYAIQQLPKRRESAAD